MRKYWLNCVQQFIDRMKIIDEMIIEQSPTAERFSKSYSKKFI